MFRLTIVIQAAAMMLTLATDGSAQPVTGRFENVRFIVSVDEVVTVRVADGSKVKGKILSVTPTSLVLEVKGQPRRLEAQDVSLISHRLRDSLWDGALALGIPPAIIAVGFTHEMGTGAAVRAGLIWGGGGAALGAGLDALFRKREVVYQSTRPARVGFATRW